MFGEKKLDLTLEDDVQPVARHPFDQDEPACSSVEEPTRRKDQVHVIGLQLLEHHGFGYRFPVPTEVVWIQHPSPLRRIPGAPTPNQRATLATILTSRQQPPRDENGFRGGPDSSRMPTP